MSALKNLLSTKSIAVIGASNHREKVGHQIVRNLLDEKTDRHIYPINPVSETILGLPVWESLTKLRRKVDLVIIATPAQTVATLIDEIIERNRHFSAKEKVKAVIIITAGFAEIDKKGIELQHLIATKLRLANIILLGPNTLGILAPHLKLNASFAQHHIPVGNLGIISQSGATLTALFDALQGSQCGVSFAISLGNKAGITENDCLEFAAEDHTTEVILLYLESFSDLPHFFELTSKISKVKPIIVLKGGTSQRGQQAAASHTAALATNQVLLQAAATQMGFTLVENIEELINVSFFLALHRQTPENVMVVTNAGGPAVNTIDELEKHNVDLAQWSSQSLKDFADSIPQVVPHTPLDLLGDASPERFRIALQIAQHDMNVDAILVIATPQAVTDMSGIVQELIAMKGKKPLFVSLIGGEHLEKLRNQLRDHSIFCTPYPNDSVDVLATMKKISQTKYRKETFATAGKRKAKLTQVPYPPTLQQAFELLKKYDFHLPKYHLITQHNLDELEKIQYPVFVKTANLSLVHKAKIGAVYGLVQNSAEAMLAYQTMSRFGNEVLFQEAVKIEQEILLGAVEDPQFGLYMTVGLGGSYTNLLGDRSYVFLPTTLPNLREAWQKTKAATLFVNQPEINKKIVEQMLNLQKLLIENPWIESLEINPLAINEKGVWATDVKIVAKKLDL